MKSLKVIQSFVLLAALSISSLYAGVLTKNGLASNPDFFPIAVWLQSPPNALAYKAAGINLYIGLWNGPVQADLDQLTSASMPALCDQNTFALSHLAAYGNVLAGWTQIDEPDNAQDNGSGGYDPCISPDTIVKRYTTMKSADSTRPVFLNLGQGVSYIGYYGRGACTGKTDMYPKYLKGCDIACFDIYPVNSTDAPITGNLWYVAKGIDSLRIWGSDKKPVWAWIECTSINGGAKPTPAQVKAEVWMALIHGAKGFGYFCHSFSPTFVEAAWLADATMKAAITAINQRVTSLAAVLNGPNMTDAVAAASGNASVPIDIMVKNRAGSMYLFAVAMRNDTATARFTCSVPGVQDSVEVLDENRKLAVSNNAFSDRFACYGVHLYKINLPGNANINEWHDKKQFGRPPVFDYQAFSRATFTVKLPASIHSPELIIVDLSGRMVFHKALNAASGKTVENQIVFDCAGSVMPAGVYIAVVNEKSGDAGALLARTKFVVGR